jgi:hypothetical protein
MELITETIELTEEELDLVAGGVRVTGGNITGFTSASGANAMSVANALGSVSTGSGGTTGAQTIAGPTTTDTNPTT